MNKLFEKTRPHLNLYLGAISLLVLLFGLIFSITIGGLVAFAIVQRNATARSETFEKALSIAQAGAQYYRWHLAHAPQDFSDSTGQPHQITDPYGQTTGIFNLEITPPASGSSIVTIESEGWLDNHPDIKRKVKARYGIPSLAQYSFLHNANVWFGSGITTHGQVLSNGGIRFDGINESVVQSAKQTYTCGQETGCSPAQTKPGVWGSGGPSSLWQFPVPQVDFNILAVDFSNLRTTAQDSGLYLAPSGAYGYHLVFNSNGSFTVTKVTGANNRRGWSVELGCENLYQQISSEQTVGTYQLVDNPVIFFEDHLWVDGVVNGKTTVVAARFPLDTYDTNIWINNNLTYIAKDGHSNLGLFAQNNIYYALNIPNDFEINAAMLASEGRIIRHHYKYSWCSWYSNAVRNSLTIYGSVISNLKSYWNFGTGPTSGFRTRDVTYDQNLYFDPPPYFPSQGEYEFISWEEE